jgi:hypothetical protein
VLPPLPHVLSIGPVHERPADLADADLDFVVAAIRAGSGEVVIPAGLGYAMTVFPFTDGVPLHWGDALSPAARLGVADMLAALRTAATPGGPVPSRSLSPRGRGQLEISLRERGRPWRGGPSSEAARAPVSEQAGGLMAAVAAPKRSGKAGRRHSPLCGILTAMTMGDVAGRLRAPARVAVT